MNCSQDNLIPLNTSDSIRLVRTVAYSYVLPVFALIGIVGNLMNLITLNSTILRGSRFVFLRAMGVLDSCALVFVLLSSFTMSGFLSKSHLWVAFYDAHVGIPAINFFFCASVLTALAFTIERYLLVQWSHRRLSQQERHHITVVAVCIAAAISFLFHFPLCFAYGITFDHCTGQWVESATEVSQFQFFKVYEVFREICTRVASVLLFAVFNALILQSVRRSTAKRRKMTLKKRSLAELSKERRKNSQLPKLSEDRRLTLLVLIVTLLYIIGLIPQVPLMVGFILRDRWGVSYPFEVYRAITNLTETATHCLHFYVFCLSSRDYRRSFTQVFSHKCTPVASTKDAQLPLIIVRRASKESNGTFIDGTTGALETSNYSSILPRVNTIEQLNDLVYL